MVMPELRYALARPAVAQSDLTVIAQYFLPLMLRNMSSDGFVFTDPYDADKFSAPGCIIASPSFERDLASVDQDYVYNWTRDAAVVACEIALAHLPLGDGGVSGPLRDYVNFASTCQTNAPTIGYACYTIEGQPRSTPPWTEQSDGPALQTSTILCAFAQLDSDTQATARAVVQRNLDYLLTAHHEPSTNLWEEVRGFSFFTRSVQLRCFQEVKGNTVGLPVPQGIDEAIAALQQALPEHWNGEHYVSVLDPQNPRDRYDPNIDIVMACVYGAADCADPRLLATAAKLRRQWSDPASAVAYRINAADAERGLGPMLGRYPGDIYDGSFKDQVDTTDHPWALCTANFAQLYYEVAAAIVRSGQVPPDPLASDFFAQVGIDGGTAAADAVDQLRDAGDAMLRAIVYHSDHLELSEQFDGTTGYEKSVRNLTWSYAAFLSAVRARTALGVAAPG
jgi:glucoamylase